MISLDTVKTKLAQGKLTETRQDSATSKVKNQLSVVGKPVVGKRSAEFGSEEFKLASVPSIQTQSTEFVTHQVSPGENLSTIARIHGVSPLAIASLNQLTDQNVLRTNQILKIGRAHV